MKSLAIQYVERSASALAAALISWFIDKFFNFLPLGSEGEAIAFAVVGAFAGAHQGELKRIPEWMRWLERKLIMLPLQGFVLFAASFGIYLICRAYIPTPPYWFVIIESVLYGVAFFFLFWSIAGAGGKLIEARTSPAETNTAKKSR